MKLSAMGMGMSRREVRFPFRAVRVSVTCLTWPRVSVLTPAILPKREDSRVAPEKASGHRIFVYRNSPAGLNSGLVFSPHTVHILPSLMLSFSLRGVRNGGGERERRGVWRKIGGVQFSGAVSKERRLQVSGCRKRFLWIRLAIAMVVV